MSGRWTANIDDEFSQGGCCFICDETVQSNGVQIILSRTPYSDIGLPTKLGQLIGDNFMVVIGVADIMCSKCASLINQLDKLETDAWKVKRTLVGHIATKYQLNHDEMFGKSGKTENVCEFQQKAAESLINTTTKKASQNNKKKFQKSLLASNNKISNMKVNYCGTCNFSTTDKDAFKVHTALCLRVASRCVHCGDNVSNIKDSEVFTYAASCKVCDLSFESEEQFSSHMSSHSTHNCSKCSICNFSADKITLLCHILLHGIQVFQCTICQATLNLKTECVNHFRSHQLDKMCFKCVLATCSQVSDFETSEISIQSVNESNTNKDMQINLKGKTLNDYVESLMRVEGFESDGTNIEFHPCPSCGLTFLNKMLFLEHLKTHIVNEVQDQAGVDDAHEEMLKSSAALVTGDCSIDDDLEDLFEKLHAETTNLSLVPDQTTLERSNCLQEQIVIDKSTSAAISFSNSFQNEPLTYVTSTSNLTEGIKPEMPSKMGVKDSPAVKHIRHPSMRNDAECTAFNSFEPHLAAKDYGCNNKGPESNELSSSQSQTFIYITSNVDSPTISDSQNLVLCHDTIDSGNDNIELLPFVLNDSKPSFKHHIPENDISSDTDLTENVGDIVPPVSNNALSCTYCSFQTSIDLVLRRHIKIHQRHSVQMCSLCNRIYSSTQRLLSHLESRHKNAGPVKCPVCSEECKVSELLRSHLAEKHSLRKQNFLCRFCTLQFPTRKACNYHEESHSEIFRFLCELCSKKFTSEEELADHVKWDHNRSGQCRYCGKKIDKTKALRNHELRHMQESNHHECPECKRVFKTKTGLRHHLASHTGQFKYCCDFCGRGFMSRMMLEEHRSCHTKEERYICDICGQKFTFQSTYWIHRKWHETPYPYKCNYCGRFFKHSSLLAVHKRKHTGERPYKCPYCPLTFPVSGTLKRHVILHTGMYPFNCVACKRGFTARHKYASHLKKVHNIKDLDDLQTIPNNLGGSTLPISNSDDAEFVQEWDLDSINVTEEGNKQVLCTTDVHVGNRDPLISDQNSSSRVVEIVLDDSYQAVATVTLGANESGIPEHWYN